MAASQFVNVKMNQFGTELMRTSSSRHAKMRPGSSSSLRREVGIHVNGDQDELWGGEDQVQTLANFEAEISRSEFSKRRPHQTKACYSNMEQSRARPIKAHEVGTA